MVLSHKLGLILALVTAALQGPQDKPVKPASQDPKQQRVTSDQVTSDQAAPEGVTSKPVPPPAPRPALLVLVNAKNPATSLSLAELRSYFKKERRFWPDGARTSLCLRRSTSPEMKVLLDEVYGWTSAQLRRHWKSKSFRGEITGGKAYTVAPTAASAIARVQANPAAITVILAADLPADTQGVRVLMIDDKRPDDAGYPLRLSAETAESDEDADSDADSESDSEPARAAH